MLDRMHREMEEMYDQMVAWRRHFHQYPEISYQEIETPKKIAEILTGCGIEVRNGVGQRGVVGTIIGAKPGKTVALRADFDALPIQDEKDVPYKSRVRGAMHACGHDGHTAALLGVAKVLSEHRDQLSGNVVLIHQHAEESLPGGAAEMIQDGCLESVDAIFSSHLMSTLPFGVVGTKKGAFTSSADGFEVTIRGKGGHGASPHQTVDAIVVAVQAINQLQLIVSRQVDPMKAAVLSVGTFQAGEAPNIIADSAIFSGTVRTFDPDTRALMEREIRRIVEGVCETLHAEAEIKYTRGYPTVMNHERETDFFLNIAVRDLGAEKALVVPPLPAADDYAYYLEKVPGMYFFTGAAMADPAANFPHHHPRFDFDERAMLVSGKLMLSLVHDFLNKGTTIY